MKIAIFGARGFLGKKLVSHFSREHEVFCADRNPESWSERVDATKQEEVTKFLSNAKPDVVIDTVALSSSVACEKDMALCEQLNFNTAKNIACACEKLGAKMVFISSSYVFDGKSGNYSEDDDVSPTNNYAKTKVMAEKEISKLKDFLILRVETMYGVDNGRVRFGTGNFSGSSVDVGYPDQLRNPLYVDDVPIIIDQLIKKKAKGIFHAGGPEKIKMLDYLKKISQIEGASQKVKVVDSSQWIVKSPDNPTVNTSKINSLGIKTTSLREACEKIRNELSRSQSH